MKASLLSDFANPGSEYRAKPFWAWNGRLDPEELRWQVRIMKQMGLGGFFMHSRVGLETDYLSEEWFDCIQACIDEAKAQDMEAWMYDEDRWPSGAAGGLVTKDPKYRIRHLFMEQRDSARGLTWDKEVQAVFAARVEGTKAFDVRRVRKGKPLRLGKNESLLVFRERISPNSDWYNGYTYLDTLSHEAVAKFIDVTHEEYRKRYGDDFGKVVPGMFTDEPNHGCKFSDLQETGNAEGLPWTGKLASVFKDRYGYSVLDHLPELFLDVNGEEVTPARHDYHDCVTFLFVDAFAKQIGQWCEDNNLLHTGHVLEEQTLSAQANAVGSCMRFFEYMQAPGMDLLTQYKREYDTAKQVSSAARQFGCKWRLTETYGCTGWDFPFVGHKAVGDWQVALGINLRCQHLSWYTMEGEAKRDYPASIFYQSPWWQIYNKVEDYFARVHAVMTQGQEVRDLLVLWPVESSWLKIRKGWREESNARKFDKLIQDLRDSLLKENIDFDYGDEDILARHGKVTRSSDGPKLTIAKAAYKTVVVPPMTTIRSSTLALLEKFANAGGKVVFAGDVAKYVDARASEDAISLAKSCQKVSYKGKSLVNAVEDTCRRVSICDAQGNQLAAPLHLLREDKDAMYLFICNAGYDWPGKENDPAATKRTLELPDVRISGFAGCKGKPVELDPETGEILAAEAVQSGDGWEIRTSLPQVASRLFVIPRNKEKAPANRPVRKDVSVRSLKPTTWEAVLSEANNLVLDFPQYRIDSGKFRKADEILCVDRAVRDHLGIAHRGGGMVQPWAQEKGRQGKSCEVELLYTFDVKVMPTGDLFLGIEHPELYQISINDTPVSNDVDCGWWCDKSLRRIAISPTSLREGTNELRLVTSYDQNHPGFEIAYLLGNFGTKIKGRNVTITEMPTSLKLGDWCKQGLSFYSGGVGYSTALRPKLKKGQRLVVQVPGYEGVAVRVLVDGKQAGVIAWQPNEVDITDLVTSDKAKLTIEVVGHRRNSHGPLHLTDKAPLFVGPGQFWRCDGLWSDDYQLVSCGLTEAPKLVVRE